MTIQNQIPTHFTPTSTDLTSMIAAAMAKCDHSIDQSKRAKEARAEARLVRAWTNEAKARAGR